MQATREVIASMWTEVVGADPPTAEANFFEHGGNSLKAMRLMGRVRARYGAAVTLRELFNHPTLAALAARVDQLSERPTSAEEHADVR